MSCIDRKGLWVLKYNYISIIYMSQKRRTQKTQRLYPIKEEPNRRNSSLRRRNPKRKRQGPNEDVFTASRIGYQLSRNKNRLFQRSIQPQIRAPSPRRKASKRKYDRQTNGYGMNAELRMGHTTTKNKNLAFIRSIQPQLRLPRTNHKQNTNLLNRELDKHKPIYTFKGLGKIIGTRI